MSIKTLLICLLTMALICGCFVFTGCDIDPEEATPNLGDTNVEILKVDYCVNSAETANVVVITFKLTNCNKYSASFGTSATVTVSQNDTDCAAIMSSSLPEANRFEDASTVHISKGENIEVIQAFELNSSTDEITIKVSKWLSKDTAVETSITPVIIDPLPDSIILQKLWRLGFKAVDESILSEHIPDYSKVIRAEKIGAQAFKLVTVNSSYYVTVDLTGAVVQISSTEDEPKLRTIYYPVTPITYDTVDITSIEEAWFQDIAGSYSENFARRIQCKVTVDRFMSLFAVNDAAVISDMTTLYFANEAVYEAAKLIQIWDTIIIQGQIINYTNVGIIIEVESFTISNK